MKKKKHQIQRMNSLERSPEKRNADLGYIYKKELSSAELDNSSNIKDEIKKLPRWLRRQKREPSRGDQLIRPGHDSGFKVLK